MADDFDSYAIVELMGHVRMAGRVTEEERFGAKVGRCDIPHGNDKFTTVYFTGASIYRLTPCSEDAARAVARRAQPEPVHQWELPAPTEPLPRRTPRATEYDSDEYPDDEDDEEGEPDVERIVDRHEE